MVVVVSPSSLRVETEFFCEILRVIVLKIENVEKKVKNELTSYQKQ